ncbi:MAG: (d)CMP kinase [Deinococcales bacterium]
MVVTIDGPAASGKSSVAKGVAKALDIAFISSGLFYRAATYTALTRQWALGNDSICAALKQVDINLVPQGRENQMWLGEEDISEKLHSDLIDANVSLVAAKPCVRAWVYECLKQVEGSFVIEGRDMGTVVFPGRRISFI